jgi:hypothetical protein
MWYKSPWREKRSPSTLAGGHGDGLGIKPGRTILARRPTSGAVGLQLKIVASPPPTVVSQFFIGPTQPQAGRRYLTEQTVSMEVAIMMAGAANDVRGGEFQGWYAFRPPIRTNRRRSTPRPLSGCISLWGRIFIYTLPTSQLFALRRSWAGQVVRHLMRLFDRGHIGAGRLRRFSGA